MESTPIYSNAIGLTLDTPIDFGFSPRLSDLFINELPAPVRFLKKIVLEIGFIEEMRTT